MWLELGIILEGLLVAELICLLFEENDSSCIVTYGEHLSCGVKLDLVDDVFLLNVLNRLLETEDLFLGEEKIFGCIVWSHGLGRRSNKNLASFFEMIKLIHLSINRNLTSIRYIKPSIKSNLIYISILPLLLLPNISII